MSETIQQSVSDLLAAAPVVNKQCRRVALRDRRTFLAGDLRALLAATNNPEVPR